MSFHDIDTEAIQYLLSTINLLTCPQTLASPLPPVNGTRIGSSSPLGTVTVSVAITIAITIIASVTIAITCIVTTFITVIITVAASISIAVSVTITVTVTFVIGSTVSTVRILRFHSSTSWPDKAEGQSELNVFPGVGIIIYPA